MQQGRGRGALAVLATVLGVTVSLFRLVPELSRFDLDLVALVVTVVCCVLALIYLYAYVLTVALARSRAPATGRASRRAFRAGTRATLKVLALTTAAVAVVAGLILVFAGPAWAEINGTDVEDWATAAKWIASIAPPMFAAGGYAAYRTWMGHRSEREQQCDWCREWVKLDARKCRYCGSELEFQKQEPHAVPRPAKAKRQPAS